MASSVLLLLAFIGFGVAIVDGASTGGGGALYSKVFDVTKYGARADGKTDNSEAFLRAWKAGCEWNGKSRIVVPEGEYMSDTVMFLGPCKGSMAFVMKGLLTPPDRLKISDKWISFRYVNGLLVSGQGTFHALGYTSSTLKPRAISLRFEFITDGVISHIRSVDSRNVHMELFGCDNMLLKNVRIKAPANSHNTDGIKIGSSTNVKIRNSVIGTGDDCIAILGKSRNLEISNVFCGPGHGISIGSLGFYPNNENDVVTGVTVSNCTFQGTSDGVRIKTWASANAGLVSNVTYRNIQMDGVQNPIVIDQHYCPYPPCDQKTPSHIRIQDVTYDDIKGTSKSDVAMKLDCSSKFDCKGIVLKDINLVQKNGKHATALCSNVYGKKYGLQRPSCI
ncbi:Exopolygalacturonase (Fragment) [Linum perenne]